MKDQPEEELRTPKSNIEEEKKKKEGIHIIQKKEEKRILAFLLSSPTKW